MVVSPSYGILTGNIVINAGQTLSFRYLFQRVWDRDKPVSDEKMRGSIQGAQTALNSFAHKPFIVLKTTKRREDLEDAVILRWWGGDKYTIRDRAPRECCIITRCELPE